MRESRFASRKERAIKGKAGSGWLRSKPVSMANEYRGAAESERPGAQTFEKLSCSGEEREEVKIRDALSETDRIAESR